jgi:probable HAF family extracellular repeat protein
VAYSNDASALHSWIRSLATGLSSPYTNRRESLKGHNMKSRTLTYIIAITLFAALAVPVQLAAQKQIHYTVTDLGTLGGTFSQAWGINNNGSIVGFATLTGDTALHAFLWRKGVMTDLGTLAGTETLPYSVAFSINDNDDSVGYSETSVPDSLNTCGDSLVCLPVLWQNGAITVLPTFGGTDGQASAINNRGQVVGFAQTSETDPACQVPVLKPAIWKKGDVRALPTAPFLNGFVGGAPGPAGNNDKGQVVGIAGTCNLSAGRALLWENNKVIDMGTIGGLGLAPVSINNRGQATGTYALNASTNHAFLWQDGVATDLGTLPADIESFGNAINDQGQIVGQTCSETACTVFLWQNGVMTDLNAVVPSDASLSMVEATGINSLGEIVGMAFDSSTGACCHAFIAIPDNREVAGSATATAVETTRPNIVTSENIRKMLRQRLGHRYHIPGTGVAQRD